MKPLSLFLAASLAANVALVGVLAAGALREPAPPAGATEGPAATRAAASLSAPAAAPADTWTQLHSDDLAAQIQRLRAEEFPPALVRAIIVAQVRERFAARRKALESGADTPYWLPPIADPAGEAQLRALAREERKMLADLLGPDPETSTAVRLQRQFPHFAPATIEQLALVRDRYDEKRAEIYAGSRFPTLDDNEKVEALEKTMRQELAGLLSPAELEDYDLRTHRVANQLRNTLIGFNPTEQEFRALYKLQSAFDAQHGPLRGPISPDQMTVRSAAQRELNEQIKTLLGPERFADYARASDFNFRRTTQLVARLQLPPATANEVYAIQQDIQRRANATRADSSLSGADRMAELGALASEAEARITAQLGARGFEAYKQNGGTWVQSLAPRQSLPRK